MKKEDFIYASSICCSTWINGFKKPQSLHVARILIVKLDEIGDMVNAVPVFQELKKKYPSASQTLWCKPFVKSLMEPMPAIDHIVLSTKELSGKYDLIIELRGTFESIAYALLHPPQYRLDRASIRLKNKLNKGVHPHEVFTNLQIIAPLLNEIPSEPSILLSFSPSDIITAQQYLTGNQVNRFAVLHCGARKKLRQWKEANFIQAANYLKKEHALDIIFAGDETDIPMISRMQAALDFRSYSVAGHFSLSAFGALCKQAQVFLGNESGPLHIAAASGCSVLGLFGPGEPKVFYPWSAKAHYLHEVLECNPCDQINCKYPNNTCMDRISVAAVKEKLNEIISK
jgi:ADP-heptose:LPS heptosyltransferase